MNNYTQEQPKQHPLRSFEVKFDDGESVEIIAHFYEAKVHEIQFFMYTGEAIYHLFGTSYTRQSIATFSSYKSVSERGVQEELAAKFIKQAKIKETETILIELKKES